MLFALRDPVSFALLAVAFVLAVVLRGVVQVAVATRCGDPGPARQGDLRPDPRRHLDPFGTIAAAISGVGWGRSFAVVARRRPAAAVAITLLPGVVVLALGLGLLSAFAGRTGVALGAGTIGLLQQGAAFPLASRALLLPGLVLVFVGLLSLFPLPPLEGGRLLFALAPRTTGWQKAEYYLVQQNYGLGALLILLLPLGGSRTLMLSLLDTLATPLVRLVTGG